jgi:5-methylcytosine-specific restriction endonuclease McrA
MKRPCIDCYEQGRLVLAEGTRCPEHRRIEQRRLDVRRGSPLQRGYDQTYRRNRTLVLRSAEVCAYCGRPPTFTDPLAVDHVVPLVRGGTNSLDNLVAAHRSCNSRKGGRSV